MSLNKRGFIINTVVILLILLTSYLIESKLIHQSQETEKVSIMDEVTCEGQGEWVKCSSNESYGIDSLLITQQQPNVKRVVVVDKGMELNSGIQNAFSVPFDKIDELSPFNKESSGKAVITVNDDLVNYDIYLETTNMDGVDIENLKFSQFNIGMMILIASIGISVFMLIRYRSHFSNNIASTFLLLSVLFGIAGAILVPALHAFDEEAHFLKAYDDNFLLLFDKKLPTNISTFFDAFYAGSYFEYANVYNLMNNQSLTVELISSAEQYVPIAYSAYFVGLSVSSFVTSNIYMQFTFLVK